MIENVICKNCGAKLVVKSTKKTAEQLKKPYYYSAYYFCPNCKKLYHDEKFKIRNQQTTLPSSGFWTPARQSQAMAGGSKNDVILSAAKNLKDPSASPQDDSSYVEIWTDGACIYNGTPKAKAAWAFVSDKTERAGLLEGIQTNNRAEAFAIYHALVWAAEKRFLKIKLYTDSQISIHGVSKDPKKVVKNRDIFEQIAQVITGCHLEVEFVKVLGHSGDVNNDRVDKLANDLARKGSI